MTEANQWTGPTWTVMRADEDIAHVMLPLGSFKLQGTTKTGYAVNYGRQAPTPDCFCKTTLVETAGDELSLSDVPGLSDLAGMIKGQLPPYDSDSANLYTKVSELISSYGAQNGDLNRLEAIIRIPCHAHGTRTENYSPSIPNHLPFTVKTAVQLYQIPNALSTDGSPLLVIHTPLSPTCPVNGNGSAIGVGKF
jgi:hypothetical protein